MWVRHESLGAESRLWQAEQWTSRDVSLLIPRTCEYITLHGKREFAYMIKDLGQRDYPVLSGWVGGWFTNIVIKVLLRGQQKGQEGQERDVMMEVESEQEM